MQTLQAWNELLSTVFFSTVLAFSRHGPHGPMGSEATLAPGRLGAFPRKLETGRKGLQPSRQQKNIRRKALKTVSAMKLETSFFDFFCYGEMSRCWS